MPPEDHLADLLERMDSEEKLPASGKLWSTADTVSFQAYREAERLTDTSLVPELREAIRTAKQVRTFEKLTFILGGLIANTRDPEAISVFEFLMQRAPESDSVWYYILNHARKARIREAISEAIRIATTMPFKRTMALEEAIVYLGALGFPEALLIVGDLLDRDCDGRGHPMHCTWALGDLEDPAALPYLRRAIERHRKSRKKMPSEIREFAHMAIERIETAPSEPIDGMIVGAWAVADKEKHFRKASIGTDRRCEIVAIAFAGEKMAVLCCDSAWDVISKHEVPSRDEAWRLAKELAHTREVWWHDRPGC